MACLSPHWRSILVRAQGCERLAGELGDRGFVPDVVINNAGFGLAGKAAELDAQEQLRMIDLNIRALTDLTLRFLPGMLARRRGGIINVASVAAFMPGPGMAVYFASKAYVLSFTDALAEELRGTGVHATSLCPGPVETGFQQRAGMRTGQHAGRVKPLSAAEVAAAGWTAFNKGERMMVPGFANKLAAYGGRSRAAPPDPAVSAPHDERHQGLSPHHARGTLDFTIRISSSLNDPPDPDHPSLGNVDARADRLDALRPLAIVSTSGVRVSARPCPKPWRSMMAPSSSAAR